MPKPVEEAVAVVEEAVAVVEEAVAVVEEVVAEAPEEPEEVIQDDPELEELLRLEAEDAQVEAALEELHPEPAGISVDDDSIWVIPETVRGPSVLRFAEDILPSERGRARVERTPRPDPNAGAVPDDRPRAKKGKRSR